MMSHHTFIENRCCNLLCVVSWGSNSDHECELSSSCVC